MIGEKTRKFSLSQNWHFCKTVSSNEK